MLEKATVLTALFTIVDDTMKGSALIQDALKRPGPAPHLSDSEVITIALYQELIGEPREDHFFRLHQASLRRDLPSGHHPGLPAHPGEPLRQPAGGRTARLVFPSSEASAWRWGLQ